MQSEILRIANEKTAEGGIAKLSYIKYSEQDLG